MGKVSVEPLVLDWLGILGEANPDELVYVTELQKRQIQNCLSQLLEKGMISVNDGFDWRGRPKAGKYSIPTKGIRDNYKTELTNYHPIKQEVPMFDNYGIDMTLLIELDPSEPITMEKLMDFISPEQIRTLKENGFLEYFKEGVKFTESGKKRLRKLKEIYS